MQEQSKKIKITYKKSEEKLKRDHAMKERENDMKQCSDDKNKQQQIIDEEWNKLSEQEKLHKKHFEIDDDNKTGEDNNEYKLSDLQAERGEFKDITWDFMFQNAHLFDIDELLFLEQMHSNNSISTIIEQCCRNGLTESLYSKVKKKKIKIKKKKSIIAFKRRSLQICGENWYVRMSLNN